MSFLELFEALSVVCFTLLLGRKPTREDLGCERTHERHVGTNERELRFECSPHDTARKGVGDVLEINRYDGQYSHKARNRHAGGDGISLVRVS